MLIASNLTKRFAGFTVIDDASFSIPKGAITACVGPNGAGKSTLVNLLSGSLMPDTGAIALDDVEITQRPAWFRAGRGLRRTFQNTTGIGEMTVRQNLELGLWRTSASKGTSTVEEIVSLLVLDAVVDAPLNTLPLGVQRKVGIGVAVIGGSTYLLLDEPLAGTEAGDRAMLQDLFKDLAARGLGIMWIEHDLTSVRRTAEYLFVVDKGKVIASGAVEAVVADPRVQDAYWGSAKVG
ncbi:MAG: ABC transporter ATP-binding protein [Rhizobiaceae bacterium]